MIECSDCGNSKIEANGRCASCNLARRKQERTKVKEVKPINKVSAKRAVQNQQYAKLRKEYLELYPVCEVVECHNKSVEIHHMNQRENERLLDVNYFLAVCRPCHEKITRDSAWAIANGYTYERTK